MAERVEMSPTHPPNAHYCALVLVKSIPRMFVFVCPFRVYEVWGSVADWSGKRGYVLLFHQLLHIHAKVFFGQGVHSM